VFVNHSVIDTIAGGATLYVIDEQALVTERFHIPTGSVLSAGDNTIGHIVIPQQNAANNLYVITASGSGSAATDVWKLNGSALFTTAALVGGIRVGGAGQGISGSSPTSALYFLAGTAGTSFNVLPVVLNSGAVTTATPLECRITYCVSPLSA
jgi:hypothetical protein